MPDVRLQSRRATVEDIDTVLRILHAAWPQQQTAAATVRPALADSTVVTRLLLRDRAAVGLTSCFPTTAVDGRRRWELDLLALIPDVHGRGLSAPLLQAALADRPATVPITRALVADGLPARSRMYARAGFTPGESLRLMVRTPRQTASTAVDRASTRLIPVTTLFYRGAWLEAVTATPQLQSAAALQDADAIPTLGTLLPADAVGLYTAAADLGFAPVGDYRWWTLTHET